MQRAPIRLAQTTRLLGSASFRSQSTIMPGLPASRKDGPGVPPNEQKRLHLYTKNTPNGKKVQIGLEELKELYGTEFSAEILDIETNYQKEEWFLKICPNGRIPALVDNKNKFQVFETAAILLYLLKEFDTNDTFGFKDELERNECLQWMFFAHGGVGPMKGQLNHFASRKEQIPYAIKRYKDESLRLYSVLDDRLSGRLTGEKRQYLAGNGDGKYSVADMNAWPWVLNYTKNNQISDEEMKKMPDLWAWLQRIGERPAVKRAVENYDLK